MVGMAEVGHQLVRMGWQPIRIVGVSACVIFILLQKIQKMANKDMTFGYHPVGAPTCLCKQEVWKLCQNAAQPCARVDELRKGWGFQIGTWNGDSLSDRAGEVVEPQPQFPCLQLGNDRKRR